jgi:hypothetical protein
MINLLHEFMNDLQQNILNGCLLGDGSLVLHINAKNAYFSYISSQKEHCDFIAKNFLEFSKDTVYENGSIQRQVYDKRTNKTYTTNVFRTRSLPCFTEIYYKWYKNKIKIVPHDLVLNKTICLYWYIGDGCLLKTNNKSGDIKLATYAFSTNEVETLSNQLLDFKSKVKFNEKEKQPYVRIPKTKTKEFLTYIGNSYPICYSYKWDFTEYTNREPRFTSHETYKEIKQLYIEGQSVYFLSKRFGIEINSIKNFLKKSNTYSPKDVKKVILQKNLNDVTIKKWNSMSEAARTLNYTLSGISEVCRGLRNTYKNFKWEFKNEE